MTVRKTLLYPLLESEDELDEDEVVGDADETVDNDDDDTTEDQPYLSKDEHITLSKSIHLVKLVLAKVSCMGECKELSPRCQRLGTIIHQDILAVRAMLPWLIHWN